MFLIQILLPVPTTKTAGRAGLLRDLNLALTEKFGGVTAYTRSPANGLWSNNGTVEEDDIVIVEVMAETLNEDWWARLREKLERDLNQEEIVIRAQEIRQL